MKNAIVIGGLSGVGKGVVKALKDENYRVIIGDINTDPSHELADVYFVDAGSVSEVIDFALKIERKIQRLDALVITVGAIDEGSILNIPSEKWKWIFNMNLFSSINLVDAFLPLLEKSENARIMLTGSGAGFGKIDAGVGLGLYAISKQALVGYFTVLRSELAEKGIQVSLLIPSAIKGSLAEHSAKMRQEIFHENFSVHKGCQPKGRILMDPLDLGVKFVADFLNGNVIITNNPLQLKEKWEKNVDDLNSYL